MLVYYVLLVKYSQSCAGCLGGECSNNPGLLVPHFPTDIADLLGHKCCHLRTKCLYLFIICNIDTERHTFSEHRKFKSKIHLISQKLSSFSLRFHREQTVESIKKQLKIKALTKQVRGYCKLMRLRFIYFATIAGPCDSSPGEVGRPCE